MKIHIDDLIDLAHTVEEPLPAEDITNWLTTFRTIVSGMEIYEKEVGLLNHEAAAGKAMLEEIIQKGTITKSDLIDALKFLKSIGIDEVDIPDPK